MKCYRKKEGGTTTEVYLNLGTASEICSRECCAYAEEWARKKLAEINRQIKDDKASIMVPFRPGKRIEPGQWQSVHCGHLLLLPLYNKLQLDKFSKEVSAKYKFKYDFADILQKLVMCRVLYPDSKRATHDLLGSFIDKPGFSLDNIYNFLSVLARSHHCNVPYMKRPRKDCLAGLE